MSYNDLVQVYFGRENALQGYWTLYVIIVGGLLAFSSMRKQPDVVTTLLITVLFGIFAYKNLGAIQAVTAQELAALDATRPLVAADLKVGELDKQLVPTLVVTPPGDVRTAHLAGDVLTICAVWAMELRRRRSNRDEVG